MKVLVSLLLLAGSSIASAQATIDWQALQSQNVHMRYGVRGSDPNPYMNCVPQLYNCGDYIAEVDYCANGSLYLRGTDIPFRCESKGY